MAYNDLNLFFGPKLPLEFESVGLAFIAAPTLRSDTAIGVLSAIRYAKQNYDHVDVTNFFDAGAPGAKLDVSYISNTLHTFGSADGGYVAHGRVTLEDEYWGPTFLNSAIKVAGVKITPADTWYPMISPGLVFRPGYVVAASGIEPSGSWLKRALDPTDANDTDYYLTLVYAVPEALYNSTQTGDVGLAFPPTQAKYVLAKELALATSPHTIGYDGNIDVLQVVRVNGTVRASGMFTGTESGTGHSFIKTINKETKQIILKSSIAPDDLIELQYLTLSDHYVYTGFRDVSGYWWPFDANPEYGHYIGNDETRQYDNSADSLINQITLYAIPSAAIRYEFIENAAGSDTIGTLKLTAYRAIDYGETHVIRHIVSSEPVEFINSREDGTIINTWGHAVFGRNFYDEQNQYGGDIFNFKVPSMIPLGRFVLGAPASVNSVSIADIRERGGGVPYDFPMIAVESQEDGLDKLRGFFDMGIWEGKAYKEGGVVEIQIDKSLLKTDPDDTDPTTFLSSEIYELVRSQIPPGIDFEIRYIENL
jgi:hypothetical protein